MRSTYSIVVCVMKLSLEHCKKFVFFPLFTCSKFVPRGSVRIGMYITNSTLEAAAFVTPTGQVVLVVMNTDSADQTVKLADVSPGGGARALKFVALAHSIQTFTFN